MSHIAGYFDSTTYSIVSGFPQGNKALGSAAMAKLFSSLVTDGVLTKATNYQVVASTGLTVTIKAGFAMIGGRFCYDDADFIHTFEPSSSAHVWWIAIRCNLTNGTMEFVYEADSTTMPLRTATQSDLVIAKISISANAGTIADADILDCRPSTTLCGYIEGALQQTVDTDAIWNAINANTAAIASVSKFKPRITVTMKDIDCTLVCACGVLSYTKTTTSKVAYFDVDDYGTWTITAYYNGVAYNSATIAVTAVQNTYTVSMSCAFLTFASNPWSLIHAVSDAGGASAVWSVGDQLSITVGGVSRKYVILDFDHDTKYGSTEKAGITIGLLNCTGTESVYNSAHTENLPYASSTLYSLLNSIAADFPEDLKSVMVTVGKPVAASNADATIINVSCKCFAYSEYEMSGTNSVSGVQEGSQYAYYVTKSNWAKFVSDTGTTYAQYWLRSAEKFNASDISSQYYKMIQTATATYTGGASATSLDNSEWVSYAFCV